MHTIRTTFEQNHHIEYVVCPKCNMLYHFSDCIIHENNGDRSKRCNHVEYPNHPHISRRSPCDEILLKKVKVGCKYKLIARKVYIYQSVVHTLKEMAKRKGFLDKCNQWRDRTKDTTFIGDIYDGKVWNDLKDIGGRPFLALPNNLCLGLNIDWFRLYEHSPYSAGAIYLVVLNLPRNERFKEENVILAGIIPGPHEPKNDINTFLSPLVDDIIELYDGISFENPSSLLGSTFIRATLAFIICDLPATRKVCGFANFNGNYGCSKCTKKFPTPRFGDKPNYGGYNCTNWTARDISSHKSMAEKYKKSPTISSRKKIIHESGIKYSELLRIPHFDVIRLHIIDPMHNVFLGLAKHTIKTWKDNGVLNPNIFTQLQEKIDAIVPPTKIGRIPRKIDSNFSSFTADEWKNWILVYSLYCLSGIVDEQHYECWRLLVESCILYCQFVITADHIHQAHSLLVEYCKKFETLYGSESCTPNMHMSCHLKECLLDFGPFASFWCFPFERYNGILEDISKSWIQPEKQMFLKFSQKQELKFLSTDVKNGFIASVLEHTLTPSAGDYSSVGQMETQDMVTIQQVKQFTCLVSRMDALWKPYQCMVPPIKEKFLKDRELHYLSEMYHVLYPTANIAEVPRLYTECKKLMINHEEYISAKARSQRSSTIAAYWPNVLGIDTQGEAPLRIAQVESFIQHTLPETADTVSKTHILAKVQWYGDHPRRNSFHSSITLCSTVFDGESSACYIPVSRIMCRCALSSPVTMQFDYGVDNVLVAIPLIKSHHHF